MAKKFNVGIIGCGDISQQYLNNAKNVYKDYFTITACGDIVVEKKNHQYRGVSVGADDRI